MSDILMNHAPDRLEAALAALKTRPIPDGPTADLVATTLRAIAPVGRRPRRNRTSRFALCAAAAALLLAFVSVGPHPSAVAAFDRALDRIETSRTVRFRIATVSNGTTLPSEQVTIHGRRYRIEPIEPDGLTWILDLETREGLIIKTGPPQHQVLDLRHGFVAPIEMIGLDVREQLLGLRGRATSPSGSEMIDGSLCDRFEIQAGQAFHTAGDWQVWVDRRSGLPVQATVATTIRGTALLRKFTRFDWAVPTTASEFDTKPAKDSVDAPLIHFAMEPVK